MINFLQKTKWALRRVSIDIPRNALVLEVGSGGNPYPRSNVLLDAFEDTRQRHWEELVHDRPTVLAKGENLPFKDKAFDFVIAAHVLEHTAMPEKFLYELERVARMGYIETPDAFMERINPYRDHRLEVTLRNNELNIRKKPAWVTDAEVVELYEQRAKKVITSKTIPCDPEAFHVRYFWERNIKFRVVNPDVDSTWIPPPDEPKNIKRVSMRKDLIRRIIITLLRKCFSQNTRNSTLDILPLMRCPRCYSEVLTRQSVSLISCSECSMEFKFNKNIYYLDEQT
jgi:hypothetical protein